MPKKPKVKFTYNQVFHQKAKIPIQTTNSIQIIGKNFKSLPIRRKLNGDQQTFSYSSQCNNSFSDNNNKVIKGRRTLLTIKKQFLTDKSNLSDGMMYTI